VGAELPGPTDALSALVQDLVGDAAAGWLVEIAVIAAVTPATLRATATTGVYILLVTRCTGNSFSRLLPIVWH
jgi:hypothetical protein